MQREALSFTGVGAEPGGRKSAPTAKEYTELFGELPHGTECQMAALLELAHLDKLEIRERPKPKGKR